MASDDPGPRFLERSRGLIFEDVPEVVVARLHSIPRPRPPLGVEFATRVRRVVAELIREISAPTAVAGARGGTGTAQFLHRWDSGECAWSVVDDGTELRISGQLLVAESAATPWHAHAVAPGTDSATIVPGAVRAGVAIDEFGEFEIRMSTTPRVTVVLIGTDIVVDCGPMSVGG